MKMHLVKELKSFADFMAKVFSDKNREGNKAGEDFEVKEISPMSDLTATVIYKKSIAGVARKDAVAFLYYSKNQNKKPGDDKKKEKWHLFFPTDTQLSGLMRFDGVKSFGVCEGVEVNTGFNAKLIERVNQMILESSVSIVLDSIIPMSIDSATVKVKEEGNGNLHYILYYRIKSGGWRFFKVQDSHISGFRRLEKYKHDVEESNFEKNF